MRLNLYWRGWDVIDVEIHVWKRRDSDPQMIAARRVITSRVNGHHKHPIGFTRAVNNNTGVPERVLPFYDH